MPDLERCWRRELTIAALETLRDAHPQNVAILDMQYGEGCKASEVAKRLGLTLAMVRYRRKRILRKLRLAVRVFTGRPFSDDV
jgi:DNA-directed RNA polymerase specialized sigma24 family protein